MLNKIILISIVAGFLLCNPASATNYMTNGDFETGDMTGWTNEYGWPLYTISDVEPYEGTYSAYLSSSTSQMMQQNVNLTNVNNLTFYTKITGVTGDGEMLLWIDYVCWPPEGSLVWTSSNTHGWTLRTVDVSGYSGSHLIFFRGGQGEGGGSCNGYIDNIIASDEIAEDVDYITWDTFPSDSWKVGNYSTLMVGVPASLKNFTFFYKTPSTDYTEMPIQKHFIHKTFNVEEGEFYYYYAKFPYHATYGNYSAKIELNEAVLDSKSVIVPYFDPDITLPDTVIIPVPEVFVDPPQWNVTIPEEYGNITWLTDYTAFCDGIGSSLNYTTYATVGLLLIPLEMLNGSVTTINEYATDAAGMVQGFEHCSIIIKVAWNIIPAEIQTLFIGAAAMGLVVFLYHRRT